MTREEAISNLRDMMGGIPFDKCLDWIETCCVAIRSLEAWDEAMKDVHDWQEDFNVHVKMLFLTEADEDATMMYGEDVVNILGNHMVELKEVEE